ncbi:amidohydrolase family protein [Burkholderia cepacia]|uniref:amidohydrolase family protein n=1 Tax=Burkholderia cepacia TaxID=292 RepID=UPI000F5DA015|nr:amidohydrolase family protein [Burkholderia cepacia]RRA20991.1 amidohydrolase [Burkholderia cepacia]
MQVARRIDVHQHVVPPFWVQALEEHGGDPSGWHSPAWSPSDAIAFMDNQGIDTGILSLTAPAIAGWKGAERREMARRINEYTAGLVEKHPTRFGNFATLTLPDIDGALREMEYALDVLRADGVILLSNYENKYLGDPLFEQLWAELDRRNALVFVHPSKPAIPAIDGLPGPFVDYPFDTTRTAVHLVARGVPNRYRRLTIILSHAGGFLPYAAHRFAELMAAMTPDGPETNEILDTFQRFYFDTAMSSGPAALPSLLAFCGSRKVLFGSDFPYAPTSVSASFTRKLDEYAGFSPVDLDMINHGNAARLFSRLVRKSDAAQ